MILEIDLSLLNKEIIYEIHELARSSHNPSNESNKKLVLKVRNVDSCLVYNTSFIVPEQLKEEISKKAKVS